VKFGLPHYKAETELSTIKRGSTAGIDREADAIEHQVVAVAFRKIVHGQHWWTSTGRRAQKAVSDSAHSVRFFESGEWSIRAEADGMATVVNLTRASV
jgi:hypothetical protein